MERRAVILAGGKGTRLKPYSIVFPKPLVPVCEHPVLELLIHQLRRYGFKEITIAVNHMAEMIMAYCGDGSKWGVKIDYSLEDRPLSTMGPLKLVKDLPENFLVMNGDVLTDLDLADFYRQHIASGSKFSIAGHRRVVKNEYGVLDVDPECYLTGFREKPVNHFLVSMGVYLVNRSVLDYIPDDSPFGFDNLMLKLLDEKQKVRVQEFSGYWLDIGRPDDYAKATDEFESIKGAFLD